MAEFTANDVATIFGLNQRVQSQEQERRDQAIRFAGAREYDSLISQGVPMEEALRSTAHKMFYNDPSSMIGSLRLAPSPEEEKPKLMNIGGSLLRVEPSGQFQELFTPKDASLPIYRSTPQGVMQIDRNTGLGKYVTTENQAPALPEKPVTTAEQLSIMRELRETRNERENLTPGTPEYNENIASEKRLKALLGADVAAPKLDTGEETEPAPAAADVTAEGLMSKAVKFPFRVGQAMSRKFFEKPAQAPAPAGGTSDLAKTKADFANYLESQHPDWSRERILGEVNKRFQ